MTEELRAEIQELLAHQLEGIMFHFDAMNLYVLMELPKMARTHHKQLVKEMEAHSATTTILINKFGEVIPPAQQKRIEINVNPEEKWVACSALTHQWLEWEISTEKLYESMVEKMPECKQWKLLLNDVRQEINGIKKRVA